MASKKVGEDSNNVINNDLLSSGIKNWIKTMYQRDEAKKFTDKLVVKYRDDTIIDDDLTKNESKEKWKFAEMRFFFDLISYLTTIITTEKGSKRNFKIRKHLKVVIKQLTGAFLYIFLSNKTLFLV